MNQMKTRLAALSLLDRALAAMTDDELTALIDKLPEGHVSSLDTIGGAGKDGFSDPAARLTALRTAAARGRIGGALEQIATVLTDPALADCITKLGDNADNPSEEQLLEVTPELVETYGASSVRLMLASSVAGEASASPMLIRLLKGDGEFGLPAMEVHETTVLPAPHADEETKAKRKAAKDAKKAAARASREQSARARGRI